MNGACSLYPNAGIEINSVECVLADGCHARRWGWLWAWSDSSFRRWLSVLWYRVLCEDAILKAVLSPQDRCGHQQFWTSIIPSIYNLGRAWLLVNNTRPLEGSVPISHVLILVQLLWLESCRMMTGQAWFMHPPLGLEEGQCHQHTWIKKDGCDGWCPKVILSTEKHMPPPEIRAMITMASKPKMGRFEDQADWSNDIRKR